MPLKVHFLNVGRGDCTIIEFPSGRIGMVDIDCLKTLDPSTEEEVTQAFFESQSFVQIANDFTSYFKAKDAFIRSRLAPITDPFLYFNSNIGYKDIFRLVITHPDMDHMTGIDRLCREKSIS